MHINPFQPLGDASIRVLTGITFRCTLVLLLLLQSACGGSDAGLLGANQKPDPAVQDFALVYVKRPLLVDDNGELLSFDITQVTAFLPGAELWIRDRASASAAERLVTGAVFADNTDGSTALYDVKDLSASSDGNRLLFAMRAPEDPDLDDDEQPTWNIWIYDLSDDVLERVIASDLTAGAGQDISPKYLPDDRILFSSTRQRQSGAILLDEGKPQFSALEESRSDPALTLHVMNSDGSDIHQISFNQSHDLDPAVLSDGRIIYSRWDQIAGRDRISLYTMNPDGSNQQVLYGIHSHNSGPNGERVEFTRSQELPDGRILVLLRASRDQSTVGADLVAIDTQAYIDNDMPGFNNSGLVANAQQSLVSGLIRLDGDPSPRGRFASVYPLNDGTDRFVAAWSQCRLLDDVSDPATPMIVPCSETLLQEGNFAEADPLYGVWMFDPVADTQQPIILPTEGMAFTEALVLESRVPPTVFLDAQAPEDEDVGILHIRSVYDFAGGSTLDLTVLSDPLQTTASARPARFLRIVKAVSIPDRELLTLPGTAFGRSSAQLMREIIGYADVEPDGSVMVKVPANIAFAVSVLDENGRRISQRHQNWMQLRSGEQLTCNGCHTRTGVDPHGRLDAEAPSANAGALVDGLSFPNTVPALFADAGETMAQVYTRINGIPDPDPDLVFDDVWTDPALRVPDAGFAHRYSDLQTPAPIDPGCISNWQSKCRIVTNYEAIIHPVFGVDRRVFDINDPGLLLRDDSCIACHSPIDAMGLVQLPAAQLDLADGVSPDQADHFNSYRELLFNDSEQEIVGGVLIDTLVQALDGAGNLLFQEDANGDLILDGAGQPVPVLVTINVQPTLSIAGANASPRFMSLFAPAGSHAGRLSGAELKLISEWLDIGAQYYNNPFDVPQ